MNNAAANPQDLSVFLQDLFSPDDRGTLDEIRAHWGFCGTGNALSDREIVDFALQLMRLEIDAGCGAEVVEDVRREIAYRRWSAGGRPLPATELRGGGSTE